MKRVWGDKRSYKIVEDGDRKGYQSGKGIKAKKAMHAAMMRGYPSTSISGELCSHGTHSFPAR